MAMRMETFIFYIAVCKIFWAGPEIPKIIIISDYFLRCRIFVRFNVFFVFSFLKPRYRTGISESERNVAVRLMTPGVLKSFHMRVVLVESLLKSKENVPLKFSVSITRNI